MNPSLRKVGRKLLPLAILAIVVLVLVPAYVRAYTLSGPSDAPTLLLGDRVWVNLASYDIRFPYTDRVLFGREIARRGDLVLLQAPDGRQIFKRVVALPGDRIAMQAYHLSINGQPLEYTPTDENAFASAAPENKIGSVIESERIGSIEHLIAYTPGQLPGNSFPEVLVPAGQCYVLGDNRGISLDSRDWGPIPCASIRGKVVSMPTEH